MTKTAENTIGSSLIPTTQWDAKNPQVFYFDEVFQPYYVRFSGAVGGYSYSYNEMTFADSFDYWYQSFPQVNQGWFMPMPYVCPKATTYVIALRGQTGVDRGQFTVSLSPHNGVGPTFSGVTDWYGTVGGTMRSFTASLEAGAMYDIQVLCTGKNASSSNYYGLFHSLGIYEQ